MDYSKFIKKSETKKEYLNLKNIDLNITDMEHKDEFNHFHIDLKNKTITRNGNLLNSSKFDFSKFLNEISNNNMLQFKESDIFDSNKKFAIEVFIRLDDFERRYYTSINEIHIVLNILKNYLFKLKTL
jgi:hypothetical protein